MRIAISPQRYDNFYKTAKEFLINAWYGLKCTSHASKVHAPCEACQERLAGRMIKLSPYGLHTAYVRQCDNGSYNQMGL